jgi:hypothetical protein
MLICLERKVLLASCWLVADKPSEQGDDALLLLKGRQPINLVGHPSRSVESIQYSRF